VKPRRSIEDIEAEFNEYEVENLKLLGQLRDELASGGGNRLMTQSATGQLPTTSAAGTAGYTPPEIHAWIGIQYDYRAPAVNGRSSEGSITATEREHLLASHVATRGAAIDRVIEGEAKIVPLRYSIRLTRTGPRDAGTLAVNVVNAVSGASLEGFPVSSKDAIAELKKRERESGGSDVTDLNIDLSEAQIEALAQAARGWVARDEGEGRGQPEILHVYLHIALGPPRDTDP